MGQSMLVGKDCDLRLISPAVQILGIRNFRLSTPSSIEKFSHQQQLGPISSVTYSEWSVVIDLTEDRGDSGQLALYNNYEAGLPNHLQILSNDIYYVFAGIITRWEPTIDASGTNISRLSIEPYQQAKFASYLMFVTDKDIGETFVATITKSSGTCTWQIFDGETLVEQVGDSCSFQFSTDGPHTIKVKIASTLILTLDIANNELISILNLASASLTSILANTNPLLVESLNNLPDGLTNASFYDCPLLTGVIDNLPDGLTNASFTSCPLLTGSNIRHMIHIEDCSLQNQNANQARINAIADDCYAGQEASEFTHASIILNIGGNNSAPSAPQITKLEHLESDHNWTITYTGEV
ncbi:MAG: hypothetical protein O8C67_00295 [Candidatus Methanoperedens sp.]|nr:hypothetical protein [Candidatus Methanoperedens sp.]